MMQCDITVADDNQYACLRVRETIVPEIGKALVREMADLQQQKGILRFLLDVRGVTSRTSPVDDFQMANREVASAGFTSGTRVAVVKSPGDTSHDFIETVGLNAGQNIRLFEAMNTALAWVRA